MKCRKCGHLIEVKAEVTETSVASKAPQPAEANNDDATRVGMDVNALLKPSAGSPGATTKPAAPRPGQPPQRTGLATSLASAKPAKPAAPPHARQESALAGAFQKSVSKQAQRDFGVTDEVPISTSAEWYVAINGVPVGPVRLSELRRKAASGAITEESLVWQEGMEEWRPLRTVPELLAIVNEGLSTERPSLVTPAPGSMGGSPRPSGAPSAPIARKPEPIRPQAPAPQQHREPMAARSNVVSLASRLATAEKLEP
jgi:hypothetical protein